MTSHPPVPLSRDALGASGLVGPTPPVRIVHLGLGAFHRSHQAWYTARAADSAEWGIAAFAGRSNVLAEQLTRQGGVYTLVERSAHGDAFEHIGSIVDTYAGSETGTVIKAIAAPATAVVTLTVTEAAYLLTSDGRLDVASPELDADIRMLARSSLQGAPPPEPSTVLGRLVAGLDARRRAGAEPLTIVPCDNFPGNGPAVERAVAELAASTSPELVSWLPDNCSYVSTSVDRITPRVDNSLTDTVAEATGWLDTAPVATEPFSDWTLSGGFPGGRPAWETSGARFVDDIEPYELRKLWLLNGAHSLLAYLGRLRGFRTVAEAISDRVCASGVHAWWNEAARHLSAELELNSYREALLERFTNPRIEHQLEQISTDGLTKLIVRIVPVARLERQSGRSGAAAATVLGAWIAAVRRRMPMRDSRVTEVDRARDGGEATQALLALVAPDLAADRDFAVLVHAATRTANSLSR